MFYDKHSKKLYITRKNKNVVVNVYRSSKHKDLSILKINLNIDDLILLIHFILVKI